MVTCAGCERPILERFLLNVLDRAWHAKCVQCIDCQCSLTEKCFSRDAKLYCRNDFFRRFGTKCGGCSQGISPNDMVRRARNKVFHLKCFTCMVCRKQLSTGEELYVLDENRFICKDDYVNSRYNGSDHDDMELELEQQLLDKLEDTMSDKASSLPDEDSQDSILTPIQSRTTNPGEDISPPPLGIDLNRCRSPVSSSPEPDVKLAKSNDSVNNNKNNNVKTPIATNLNNNDNEDEDEDDEDEGDVGEGINKDGNKENSENKDNANESSVGTKRRGPRTTIKAKQLETLKAAFAATPKPTRHIREQLAQETGLNMRVIQVWFQNRRSKERRMKQLSALGARRHFFRNPRRIRGLRPGEELVDNPDMMGQPGFNYFENGEFYATGGYPGYGDYFGQQGDPGNLPFLPPTPGQGPPPGIDHSGHPANNGSMRNEGPFMTSDLLPNSTSSPEPNMSMMQHPDMHHFGNPVIPRSLPSAFALAHAPPEMVVGDAW